MSKRIETPKRVLTEEEAERIGVKYEILFKMALAQVTEHQMWLHGVLMDMVAQGHDIPANVIADVKEIKLVQTLVEEGIKEVYQDRLIPTISVVWEYTDALYAFLASPGLPKFLNDLVAVGTIVDDH